MVKVVKVGEGMTPKELAEKMSAAASDVLKRLIKMGVLVPTKVERIALQNAASVASLLLTTEALVTDIPEKDKMPSMPGGGMEGMM